MLGCARVHYSIEHCLFSSSASKPIEKPELDSTRRTGVKWTLCYISAGKRKKSSLWWSGWVDDSKSFSFGPHPFAVRGWRRYGRLVPPTWKKSRRNQKCGCVHKPQDGIHCSATLLTLVALSPRPPSRPLDSILNFCPPISRPVHISTPSGGAIRNPNTTA